MSFKPSKYQVKVFEHIKNGEDSLIIRAVAGSGKTTTLVNALSHSKNRKTIFIAFNKNIQRELSVRVPKGVDCKTCHSVGFAALRNHFGKRIRMKVDGRKTWTLLRNLKKDGIIEHKDISKYGSFVAKMIGLAKNHGIGISDLAENTYQEWANLALLHDVTLSSAHASMDRAIELCMQILRASIRETTIIDFDDMIYMPILLGANFQRYQDIYFDEAQDANAIQRAMVEAMLTADGRAIFVGDERQAIYGFRGADSESMNKLKEQFDCVELPLSVSYRCAKNVVKEAQRYSEDIEFFEHSEDGIVEDVHTYTKDTFTRNDVIVCRNTAPLVKMAYALIGKNVGVNFLGREIGKTLVNLVKKLDAESIDDLEFQLDSWEKRETLKAKEKNQDNRIQGIEDKAACIRIFISNLSEKRRNIESLIVNIENLFAEKKGQLLTLCTIHKSKGLEWNRVFFLDSFLIPSKYAKLPWMQVQESNLAYVAITRAKTRLSYISSDCFGSKDEIQPVSFD